MHISNKYKIAKIQTQFYEQGLEAILDYLWSDKFNGSNVDDKMVNREDIALRISETRTKAFIGDQEANELLEEFPVVGKGYTIYIGEPNEVNAEVVSIKGDQVKLKYLDNDDKERFMFKDFWELY